MVRLRFEDEWLQWLLALRPGQILWRYDWLMRSMGHTQELPPAGALFQDTLTSPRVTVAILGSWFRGAHVVEAGVFWGRTTAYEDWWIVEHGDRERESVERLHLGG
ncbi:hypothetical protein JCGZ_02468 [Jatropha curcas]|uniref:Uncharacterized protein n=1 Tax=Jatropha curcas TaxID=180498 RepID=A0A067JIN9_JATCU|nr:hypothetical protein JCGZ_02468 [Jatropha curcas]